MKGIIIALALLAPLGASADISVIDLKLNGANTTSVLPGGDVEFEFVVDRQPNAPGSANDFQSYRVDILPDGLPQGACVNVNHTFGAGTSTESYILAASTTEATYDAEVRIYREDNCVNERDVFVVADGVEVKKPTPPAPPAPVVEKSRKSGGFVYCSATRTEFCRPVDVNQIQFQLAGLIQKLIEALQQEIENAS